MGASSGALPGERHLAAEGGLKSLSTLLSLESCCLMTVNISLGETQAVTAADED